MTNKLLTLKQLAEIIKYATRIVTIYTDLGVAIPNDLERIVKLLDHITALEAELDDTLTDKMKLWDAIPKPYHEKSVFLAGVHRITALEVERAELPHDSLCATTINDQCDCYKRELFKQEQEL